jgi:hypothetical protein
MAVDVPDGMAKTRKRSDIAAAEPDTPVRQPESPEPPHETNGYAARVAARAYELYLARGGSHGSDWDDWLAAERELVGTGEGSKER